MDLLDALDSATDEFGRRLALVGENWTSATPCPEWDVHYLAAHVVGGNCFAVLILGGMSASDAIDHVMSAPQLGDDPLTAWATTSAAQVTAFRVDTALERDIVENGPPGMGFGIAALGSTDRSASPQARLLDLTGRAAE